MSTWITQAKQIFEGLSGTLPNNATLLKHATSMARQAQNDWTINLAKHDLVVNPNLTDIFDIGTVDGAGVFTADPGQLNQMLAFHFRARVRSFVRSEILADRKKTGAAVAGDAGLAPDEIAAANRATAVMELLTDLGDVDNDPES
jgi:hypothetical protein